MIGRIERAAQAIYEQLRCGPRAQLPYSELPERDKIKMRQAAVAAEQALK